MTIQEIIFKSLNISRLSNVPCLYLSNPGVGKTTLIYSYAKAHNYKVTELRGSTSSPEDILGYFVNEGKDYLQVKYPEWFIKLIEDGEKNIPHLLFLDELTTVSRQTQAALLKLIFDREIHGKKLPDTTLIVAAGNYNSNLAHGFGLISPVLNRFCIINLHADINTYINYVYNNTDAVQQDLMFPAVLQKIDINHMQDKLAVNIKNIIEKYSKSKNSTPIIDLNNTDYSAVDNVDGEIFGILTPRTINYLSKMMIGCKELGYDNLQKLDFIVLGLIGFGTGGVTDKDALIGYQKEICNVFLKILNNISDDSGLKENLNQLTKDIDIINNMIENIKEMSSIDYIMTINRIKEHVITLDNMLGYKNIYDEKIIREFIFKLSEILLKISNINHSIFKQKINGRNITIHNNIMDVIIKTIRGENIFPIIKNNHDAVNVFKHQTLLIK